MTRIEEIEAREKAATVAEALPRIREEELRRMHKHDAYYFARELNEARGRLEALEALPKGWHRNYQPTAGDEWWIEQLARILHPQEAE